MAFRHPIEELLRDNRSEPVAGRYNPKSIPAPHHALAVPTSPVTMPVPAPADPHPHRAHELHRVEAKHRADERRADGKRRGELPAGAATMAGHERV